jgi:hypothetical protein
MLDLGRNGQSKSKSCAAQVNEPSPNHQALLRRIPWKTSDSPLLDEFGNLERFRQRLDPARAIATGPQPHSRPVWLSPT